MHHIKSDILTSHLSPILTELRPVALASFTLCVAEPWHVPASSVIFSLPSVAWDDFAPVWPAHSMRETVWDVAAHVESR